MAIDLSALEETTLPSPADGASHGKPLQVPLDEIEEDPDQPRKEFPPESMAEMVASIKAVGVKTPVSLRIHPSKAGKYLLNYGARRYRGSLAAGVKTIPAFIDEVHTDYDQVTENLQRENLTPMELALFIKSKIDAGDSAKTIAKKLGKPQAMVTEHMALIDAPDCIQAVYDSGRSQSPRTLYELRGLYDKFPDQVDTWVRDADDVTRKTVSMLADALKGKKAAPAAATTDPKIRHDELGGADVNNQSSSAAGGTGAAPDSSSKAGTPNRAAGGTSFPSTQDPNVIKKPVLFVEFNRKLAVAILNRKPTAPDLIWIRMEQGGDEVEVEASECKLSALLEGAKPG